MKGIIFGVGHYWEMVKPHLTDRLEVLSYMDNNVKFCSGGGQNIFATAMERVRF